MFGFLSLQASQGSNSLGCGAGLWGADAETRPGLFDFLLLTPRTEKETGQGERERGEGRKLWMEHRGGSRAVVVRPYYWSSNTRSPHLYGFSFVDVGLGQRNASRSDTARLYLWLCGWA